MTMPGPRLHAVLSWSLLLAVIAVAYLALVSPLETTLAAMEEEVDTAYRKAARMRALAEALPQMREREQLLEKGLAQFYRPLSASEEREAVLDMRKLLERRANEAGVQLTSVDNLSSTEGEGYGRVGLMVGAEAEVTGAAALLRALEEERPFLLMDDMTVQLGRRHRVRRGGRAPQQEAPVSQVVQMRFSLFRLKGGQSE